MSFRLLFLTTFLTSSLGVHCSSGSSGHGANVTSRSALPVTVAKGEPDPSPTMKEEDDDWAPAPGEKFENGRKAFDSARDTLLKRYYAEGMTEDDLYRAAVAGMMERADPRMRKWNKLLSPGELQELRNDLKGELIGIGVQIHFDQATGHSDVLGTLPGSPAERAGIAAGDRIVSVNGKLFKGKTTREMVGEIRGKVGEALTLSVLRDDKLLPMTITRDVVTYDPASGGMLVSDIGYLRVRSFTSKTVPLLKSALDVVAGKKARGVVLDLRQNHGGSFDDAVASAELFLPSGTGIVSLQKRDEKEERFVSKGSPATPPVPMVVLVDHATSSGAELLTAALSEGLHVTVVGTRTFGKWTVQTVDELPNGYAIKYTVSLFKTPSGKTYEGAGLLPDVEVDMDEKLVEKAQSEADPESRLAIDPQLRTAVAILRTQR